MYLIKKLVIFLMIVLVSNTNLYSKPQSAPIKKGESATFDGVILNREMAEEHRKEFLLKDLQEKELFLCNEKTKQCEAKVDYFSKKLDLSLKDNEQLLKDIESDRKKSTLYNILWFWMGALVGGFGVYVGAKIIK